MALTPALELNVKLWASLFDPLLQNMNRAGSALSIIYTHSFSISCLSALVAVTCPDTNGGRLGENIYQCYRRVLSSSILSLSAFWNLEYWHCTDPNHHYYTLLHVTWLHCLSKVTVPERTFSCCILHCQWICTKFKNTEEQCLTLALIYFTQKMIFPSSHKDLGLWLGLDSAYCPLGIICTALLGNILQLYILFFSSLYTDKIPKNIALCISQHIPVLHEYMTNKRKEIWSVYYIYISDLMNKLGLIIAKMMIISPNS